MWVTICYLVGFAHGNPLTNSKCAEEYCAKEGEECFLDIDCDEYLACSGFCMATWNLDNTTQKVHAQNCTMKCAASFENNVTDNFMACMFEHNCITFPPINISCPSNVSLSIQKNSSIANLEGEWWQHYGYNQLWDCYPCQHIHNMYQINSTNWSYDYSYEVYMVNNSLKYYEQIWILPNTIKGNVININYIYMGTPHNESWYILQATNRYVALVVCSYISTWTNVGSIVWVRPNIELTNTELNQLSNVYYHALGWKFPQQFCMTQHGSSCQNSNTNKYINLNKK